MSEIRINLPDFDDMVGIAEQIKEQNQLKADLEHQIKLGESEVYRTTAADLAYYQGGKPPSVAFVKATYEFTGLTGDLVPLRKQLGEVEVELAYLEQMFDIMKIQVDLYRTEAANKRMTSL